MTKAEAHKLMMKAAEQVNQLIMNGEPWNSQVRQEAEARLAKYETLAKVGR